MVRALNQAHSAAWAKQHGLIAALQRMACHRSCAALLHCARRYILVYPQGCDVCNHLSLFLCVADYDKLLPGASPQLETTRMGVATRSKAPCA